MCSPNEILAGKWHQRHLLFSDRFNPTAVLSLLQPSAFWSLARQSTIQWKNQAFSQVTTSSKFHYYGLMMDLCTLHCSSTTHHISSKIFSQPFIHFSDPSHLNYPVQRVGFCGSDQWSLTFSSDVRAGVFDVLVKSPFSKFHCKYEALKLFSCQWYEFNCVIAHSHLDA